MISPAYRYRAIARDVIDGDTFEADVDLGFSVHLHARLRLRNFAAPELHAAGGLEAREKLTWLLYDPATHEPASLVVETHKSRTGLEVRSFARWVADVWLPDGRPLRVALGADE